MPTFTAPTRVPYRSKAGTDAAPTGRPQRNYPLPDDSPIQLAAYGFAQEFEMLLSSFPPAAKNTPSNDSTGATFGLSDASAILTKYSQPSNTGADLGRFTAQFNVVPATWSDYKSLPFTFPGFLNTASAQPRRDPPTHTVTCRMQYDYYVIDPAHVISSVADGTPGTATSLLDSGGTAVKVVYKLGDIPTVSKSIFCAIVSGTPDTSQITNSLVASGGIITGGTTYLETLPYPTNYKSWLTNVAAHGWGTTVWDGTTNGAGSGNGFGQIVAEDSRIEPYAGNIVARVTLYVLAK